MVIRSVWRFNSQYYKYLTVHVRSYAAFNLNKIQINHKLIGHRATDYSSIPKNDAANLPATDVSNEIVLWLHDAFKCELHVAQDIHDSIGEKANLQHIKDIVTYLIDNNVTISSILNNHSLLSLTSGMYSHFA